jgi:hypothetical protein
MFEHFVQPLWPGSTGKADSQGDKTMLWTIIVLLLVLWALGLAANVGGLIHILLVVALVVFVVNALSGRRTAL